MIPKNRIDLERLKNSTNPKAKFISAEKSTGNIANDDKPKYFSPTARRFNQSSDFRLLKQSLAEDSKPKNHFSEFLLKINQFLKVVLAPLVFLSNVVKSVVLLIISIIQFLFKQRYPKNDISTNS